MEQNPNSSEHMSMLKHTNEYPGDHSAVLNNNNKETSQKQSEEVVYSFK